MKKLFFACLMAIALTFAFNSSPAWAGDAASGAKIFSANCNACHLGGKNTINPAKTLKKADLEKNSKFSEEAIIAQVTKGAGAMPPFGGRLSPTQIEDVAAYVFEQAGKGW